jgi:hypothetical protein
VNDPPDTARRYGARTQGNTPGSVVWGGGGQGYLGGGGGGEGLCGGFEIWALNVRY